MRAARLLLLLLVAVPTSCIAPSVVAPEDRAIALDDATLEWRPGEATDVPGTYVSTVVEGPLAVALRKVVYLFETDGSYTGAGLIDGAPARFQVIDGRWEVEEAGLRLDGGPAATLEVAPDGSLRITGDEGRVVLRRELDR